MSRRKLDPADEAIEQRAAEALATIAEQRAAEIRAALKLAEPKRPRSVRDLGEDGSKRCAAAYDRLAAKLRADAEPDQLAMF